MSHQNDFSARGEWFTKLNRRIKTLLSLNEFLDFIFLMIVVNIIEYNIYLKFPMNGIQLDVDVGTIKA